MSYKEQLQANNAGLEEILETVNDLPDAIQRSPFPVEVKTYEGMIAKLNAATPLDVGAVYKYVGRTSKPFERGALYIIAEEND